MPGALASSRSCCTRPGTVSTLPASDGTQKLWITSPLFRPISAARPAGRWISLAAAMSGPPPGSR